MPIRRRGRRPARKGRRRFAKKRGMGRPHRGMNMNPHYAVITETNDYGAFGVNTVQVQSLNIANYPRALAVAPSFKFYRLKHIEWIYTPEFNTFQEGSAFSQPYFYYVMNRTGDQTLPSLAGLESQGAVPISFTKQVKIKYRPNLLQILNVRALPPGSGSVDNAVGGEPVFSKWIPTQQLTNPQITSGNGVLSVHNNPQYYGHYWTVKADIGSGTVGYLSCKCVWEFKEPQVYNATVTPNKCNGCSYK